MQKITLKDRLLQRRQVFAKWAVILAQLQDRVKWLLKGGWNFISILVASSGKLYAVACQNYQSEGFVAGRRAPGYQIHTESHCRQIAHHIKKLGCGYHPFHMLAVAHEMNSKFMGIFSSSSFKKNSFPSAIPNEQMASFLSISLKHKIGMDCHHYLLILGFPWELVEL